METTSALLSKKKQSVILETKQYSVLGIVYDKANQKSLSSIVVELYNLDTSEIYNTKSNSEGKFKFVNLEESKYIILISALNYNEYSHYFTLDEDKDYKISITYNEQSESVKVESTKQKPFLNSLKRIFAFKVQSF